MKPILKLVIFTACLAPVVACDNRATYEEGEATPAVSEAEIPGTDARDDLSPPVAQARLDDFTLGSDVALDGSVPAAAVTDDFAPGEDVHLAMDVSDAPAGSAVRVVWLGESDARLHDETKTVEVGVEHLTFRVDTDNWALGDYRAEVWLGDERVNTQHFQIVEPDAAS
jgi:hypothetical protein